MALASPSQIVERLDETYRPEKVVAKFADGITTAYDVAAIGEAFARAGTPGERDADDTDRPVIRLVNYIVAEGIEHRASDIHIEPEEGGVAVRFRIDGVLRQVMMLPRAAGVPLVSRIKITASLDIADRLRPQDGRARVSVNGRRVDLRVSTLPAAQGEKIVIRVLDQQCTELSLDALGVNPDELIRLKELLAVREGVLLVTGPTGSGKTTTLYSMLRALQGRGVNIITVEDPVEYRLPGIVQVQVNEKAGLTFVAALRSILRQDPDVILVGEIRDRETANIAVQASLTGHFVLATLHTIDAPSSITRLVDIGIEPYKIAAAIKGIVAQRLLRRLCTTCREPELDPVPERLARWFPDEGPTRYRAVGCPACAMTGYRGRFSVIEVLSTSREFERRVAAGVPVDELVEAARDAGMKSLWESGVQHVCRGETDLGELLRVLEAPAIEPARVLRVADAISAYARDIAPPKVLLVGDDTRRRRILKELLERAGFTCGHAVDGVTALDEIDRAAPDIVVLDLNLPGLDGFAVLRRLRAHPAAQNLPVIVLTAGSDEESEVRAFECGANDYLTKPFRPQALVARLNALLARGPRQ